MLAIAILEALLQQQATIIASTHFAKVKSFATTREDILLSSVTFDMETMMPTYHYVEGVSGQSNAFAIAKPLSFAGCDRRARTFFERAGAK